MTAKAQGHIAGILKTSTSGVLFDQPQVVKEARPLRPGGCASWAATFSMIRCLGLTHTS